MDQLNIQEIMKLMSEEFAESKIKLGDFSDFGNEMGYIIGTILQNPSINQDQIDDFIIGFKHGVSLTNGTHF